MMKKVMVSDQWPLMVPDYREKDVEWDSWERDRLEHMSKNIHDGDVVFDVGAEQGDMPALYGTWGADVIPFEPNPLFWPSIRAIWKANVDRPILGSFAGFAADFEDLMPGLRQDTFALPYKNKWPGCAYGKVQRNHDFRNVLERKHDTPTCRIDNWVERNEIDPTVMTIDVEGAEGEVLRGAKETILRCKPLIYLSLHLDFIPQDYDYDSEYVLNMIRGFGYTTELIVHTYEDHYFCAPKKGAR